MKKFFRLIRNLFFAFAALFIVALFFVVGMSFWQKPLQKADAIIVLGAAINTPAAYNRSLEGLRLYQQGMAPVLVLSGGEDYPKSISEAQYMKNVILASSSSTPRIILDPDSRSTYENIKNSRQKISQTQSVIIVSDKYHLARAALLAYRLGFKKVYWSAPDIGFYGRRELYFYYLREAAALIFYLPKLIRG